MVNYKPLFIVMICSGELVENLASKLDSVEHNKGMNELYDLDEKPGHIFCSTHTVLRFRSVPLKQR